MGEGEWSSVGRRFQRLLRLRETGLAVPSPVGYLFSGSGCRAEGVKKIKSPEISGRKHLIYKMSFSRFRPISHFFTASLRQPRRVQRRNGSNGSLGLLEAFAPLDAALLVAAR